MQIVLHNSLVFTYILSVAFLSTPITTHKNVSVLFASAGAILIVFFGRETTDGKSRSEWWGVVLSIACWLDWSVHCILFAKFRGNSATMSQTLAFSSLTGIVCMLMFWIPIPFLHFYGIEKIQGMSPSSAWLLALTAFNQPILNAAGLLTINFSSPLFFQIGCVLAIPAGVLLDYVLLGARLKLIFFVGTVLVIISWALDVRYEMTKQKNNEPTTEIGSKETDQHKIAI